MKSCWLLALTLILLAAWWSWLHRYAWHNANNPFGDGHCLYRCDRWTGRVTLVAGEGPKIP